MGCADDSISDRRSHERRRNQARTHDEHITSKINSHRRSFKRPSLGLEELDRRRPSLFLELLLPSIDKNGLLDRNTRTSTLALVVLSEEFEERDEMRRRSGEDLHRRSVAADEVGRVLCRMISVSEVKITGEPRTEDGAALLVAADVLETGRRRDGRAIVLGRQPQPVETVKRRLGRREGEKSVGRVERVVTRESAHEKLRRRGAMSQNCDE